MKRQVFRKTFKGIPISQGCYVVFDTIAEMPYLNIGYPDAASAEEGREDLLKHFPENHSWRRRLKVRVN